VFSQGSKPIDLAGTSLLLCGAIKLCDFGHVYADHRSHIDWSHRLEEEMFNQGDFERSLGLPVSPLMDRTKDGVTKTQIGFFEFVVLPLVSAWIESFPACKQGLGDAIKVR
jgi:hypothetical protein